ncbi:MAG: DUF192 domain-containing protein [Chloroflexi bacterium]|nr:DUF192 domain-containing protein [Chloroflexota bacterium]MDA1145848.1 DUF192 domain-containing protein [Chloroflexota bacterium]
MTQRRHHPRLALAGATLLLLTTFLTACGDDTLDPIATASASTTPTSASVSPTPIDGTPIAGTPTPGTPTPGATEGTASSASATPSSTPHVVVTASADEPVASTAYIPASELPLAVMTRGDGTAFTLPLEVPGRGEYSIGLSGRRELGERGMLFWYPESTNQSFWMLNTHFDLSIAFVDGDAVIVDILDLKAESLDVRGPGHSYRYAIEAPVGWFAERGIGTGDRAVLDFAIPDSVR